MVVLSALVRVAFPSLFVSSLPKRAIGFSYPRGKQGLMVGSLLLGLTFVLSYSLASSPAGMLSVPLSLWLFGGTGGLMVYNSLGDGVAFVKPLCSTCRLLPVIEEHEAIHLSGIVSEQRCWEDARARYSFASLGLANDPRICSYCPIAKRLSEE